MPPGAPVQEEKEEEEEEEVVVMGALTQLVGKASEFSFFKFFSCVCVCVCVCVFLSLHNKVRYEWRLRGEGDTSLPQYIIDLA